MGGVGVWRDVSLIQGTRRSAHHSDPKEKGEKEKLTIAGI